MGFEREYIGHFYTANGISNQLAHIYFAYPVSRGTTDHKLADVIQVRPIPLDEAPRLARANEISDGPTALAMLLCQAQLLALKNGGG